MLWVVRGKEQKKRQKKTWLILVSLLLPRYNFSTSRQGPRLSPLCMLYLYLESTMLNARYNPKSNYHVKELGGHFLCHIIDFYLPFVCLFCVLHRCIYFNRHFVIANLLLSYVVELSLNVANKTFYHSLSRLPKLPRPVGFLKRLWTNTFLLQLRSFVLLRTT